MTRHFGFALCGALSGLALTLLQPAKVPARTAAQLVAPQIRLQAANLAAQKIEEPKHEEACTDSSFTLVHVNDLQARYSDRIEGRSRYGYIAGYMREIKAKEHGTIVLDAGDDYEKGSLVDLRSKGEATRSILRHLPIDARTIGNHDFAYGAEAVRKDVRESKHAVLSANIHDPEETFRASVVLKAGCVRVGVIGLTTQNYDSTDQQTKEAYAGIFAHDAKYAARLSREVAHLRKDVDVVVALTHLGLSEDYALALRVSGVDLIVGGHSEDKLPRPVPVRKSDGSVTWILQAGRYGEFVGHGRVKVEPESEAQNGRAGSKRRVAFEKYELVPVNARMPFAEDVGNIVESLEAAYAPDLLEPIGNAKDPRGQYNGMADLVFAAVKGEWHGDALLIGKDLFWRGISEGPITLQGLYETVLVQRQPAGTSGFSSLVEVELSGAELASAAASFRGGVQFNLYLPPRIELEKRYRLFVEKRTYEHPQLAFRTLPKFDGTPRGELIDLLESHVRAAWGREGVASAEKKETRLVE